MPARALCILALCAAACNGEADQSADLSGVTRLGLTVKRTLSHRGDRRFTEGLVMHGGYIYEGTGLVNATAIRRIDPADGRVVQAARMEDLIPGWSAFGEGITVFNNELIQLTYQQGRAYLYSLDLKNKPREVAYQGEGWGLTHDGVRLISSDGSATLTFRDPATFTPVRRVEVVVDSGGPGVDRLNELEYAGGVIWANRFLESYLLAIDPGSGQVRGLVDASDLSCSKTEGHNNVLNGIAHDPARGTFYLTGKNCADILEVELQRPTL